MIILEGVVVVIAPCAHIAVLALSRQVCIHGTILGGKIVKHLHHLLVGSHHARSLVIVIKHILILRVIVVLKTTLRSHTHQLVPVLAVPVAEGHGIGKLPFPVALDVAILLNIMHIEVLFSSIKILRVFQVGQQLRTRLKRGILLTERLSKIVDVHLLALGFHRQRLRCPFAKMLPTLFEELLLC